MGDESFVKMIQEITGRNLRKGKLGRAQLRMKAVREELSIVSPGKEGTCVNTCAWTNKKPASLVGQLAVMFWLRGQDLNL